MVYHLPRLTACFQVWLKLSFALEEMRLYQGNLGLALVLLCRCLLQVYCQTTDPLAALSDEFDDPSTLSNWQRAYLEDGWTADLIESAGIADSAFTAVPFASGWFNELRGNFFFKELTGDFVVTAHVNATGRNSIVPSSTFSLGGLMARVPNLGFGQWDENSEVWTFIAMGTGNRINQATEFEVKTTVNSGSTLELRTVHPTGGNNLLSTATLQLARFGNNLMVLVQPDGQPWEVYRCYGTAAAGAAFPRSEVPAHGGTLQVGMNMYSDFSPWSSQPDPNNASTPLSLLDSNPDLRISYDYIRFCTPPSNAVMNQDWFDPACSIPGGQVYGPNCCRSGVNAVLEYLADAGDDCTAAGRSSASAYPFSSAAVLLLSITLFLFI